MKTIYKISLSLFLIILVAYFVYAQTQPVESKMETGRIVVSTAGASATWSPSSNNYFNSAAVLPTEFIPLPKKKCDITVASPIWAGFSSLPVYQVITFSEAKNSTASRNTQTCAFSSFDIIHCDGKIHLNDEYYLLRIDFAKPVPYFSVNYQCGA